MHISELKMQTQIRVTQITPKKITKRRGSKWEVWHDVTKNNGKLRHMGNTRVKRDNIKKMGKGKEPKLETGHKRQKLQIK